MYEEVFDELPPSGHSLWRAYLAIQHLLLQTFSNTEGLFPLAIEKITHLSPIEYNYLSLSRHSIFLDLKCNRGTSSSLIML